MYVESKIESQKPETRSSVENLVSGILELAKCHLATMNTITKLRRKMGELIVDQAYLAIANDENTTNAKQITAIVDQSILFRSLGGGE